MNLRFYPLLICAVIAALAGRNTYGQAKKYAVCVGVGKYDHDLLSNLPAAEKDATALHNYLTTQEYQSVLLVGQQATKAAIEAKLKSHLASFKRGDTIVVFFAGHGLQFEGKDDGYFCSVDAKPFLEKSDTMVSLNWIYEEMKQGYRGVKILLVDACRDNPNAARSVSKNLKSRGGVDSSVNLQPPGGLSAFFACSPGQRSFEGEQHGLFTQSLLEGLRDGKAADGRRRVTWDSLKAYVKERTEELATARGTNQNPEERTGGLTGVPVLAMATATAADRAAGRWTSISRNSPSLQLKRSLSRRRLLLMKHWRAKRHGQRSWDCRVTS